MWVEIEAEESGCKEESIVKWLGEEQLNWAVYSQNSSGPSGAALGIHSYRNSVCTIIYLNTQTTLHIQGQGIGINTKSVERGQDLYWGQQTDKSTNSGGLSPLASLS